MPATITLQIARKVNVVDSKVTRRGNTRKCSQTVSRETVIDQVEVPLLFSSGCWGVHEKAPGIDSLQDIYGPWVVSHIGNGMAAGRRKTLKEAQALCKTLGLIAPSLPPNPLSRDVQAILGPVAMGDPPRETAWAAAQYGIVPLGLSLEGLRAYLKSYGEGK